MVSLFYGRCWIIVLQFNPDLSDKGSHSFHRRTYLKMNVSAGLEFKYACNDITIQHVIHYPTENATFGLLRTRG